jgi:hypothetical protein
MDMFSCDEDNGVTPEMTLVREGPAREAALELSQSENPVDQNTATQLAAGSIRCFYFEDLDQPPDLENLVRGAGYDPTTYTAWIHPTTNELLFVPRSYDGFRANGSSNIFGVRAQSVRAWRGLLVHETNHALNLDAETPLERYRSEFRAYWVSHYSHMTDLDERAEAIRAHILASYPDISAVYEADAEVRRLVDAHTRPDGNVYNN